MNIALPKPEHYVSTFRQIGIAFSVTYAIALLNRMQCRVLGRVAVPEVTVPLNNDTTVWQQGIDYKFSTYQMLFAKGYAKSSQKHGACGFKFRPCCPKFSANPSLYNASIATRIRAVVDVANIGRRPRKGGRAYRARQGYGSCFALVGAELPIATSNGPTWDIKNFVTFSASFFYAGTIRGDGVNSRRSLGFSVVLPSVCAIERAEGYGTFATRDKSIAAVATRICAATVAPTSNTRTSNEWLITSAAYAKSFWGKLHCSHYTVERG